MHLYLYKVLVGSLSADENTFFWQYLVIGADAFITTNINPAIGLANRTPVICHSLLFNNYQIQEQILQSISDGPDTGLYPLPYGSELILNQTPRAINVEII
jgi:hypothetical protein